MNKIQTIKKELKANPELMADVKAKYEKSFGIDQKHRTIEQWNNLVRVYGIEIVCKKEGMTEKEVNAKCESFSQRIAKINREKNLGV